MDSPVLLTAPPVANRARRYAVEFIGLAILIFMYAGVVRQMWRAWLDEAGASHGILIPPLVAYLIWMERKSILQLPIVPDARGIWATALGCAMYLVGLLGAEFFVTRTSLIVIMAGLIWTFWGTARLSRLSFPLLLLSTMIPLPQLVYKTVTEPLQLLASASATQIAQMWGVSVFRDGNIIHLAGTSLGVEEACSGLHSLSALIVGALLVGFLNLTRRSTRLILLVSAVPIAVAANVIRVAGTAILADYRAEFAMGFYHSFSGWLVFLLAFGMLLLFSTGLQAVEKRLR